jgi:polysaccharide export outer membrane protein
VRVGHVLTLSVQSVGARVDSTLVVDGSGHVHVASACDVHVADLTLGEAELAVQKKLRERDRLAHVELRSTGSGGKPAGVLGAVSRPGLVVVAPGMRVSDVIAAVGGVLSVTSPATSTGPAQPAADLDRAVLLRRGAVVPISLEAAIQAKTGHDVYVKDGDYLYVPFAEARQVVVLGQVNGPSLLTHHDGLRLTEALSSAGGVTVFGDKDDIRILRGAPEKPSVYQTSLDDIADGEQSDVLLLPGDAVFVQDHPIEDIGEAFSTLLPLTALGLAAVAFALALP